MPLLNRIMGTVHASASAWLMVLAMGAPASGVVMFPASGGHEFLMDHHVVLASVNAVRRPVEARKYDLNPVLSSEFPWETASSGLDRVTAPTVWIDDDDGLLRMLYWAREPGGDNIIRAAAESADGRTWTRTLMDRYPYAGHALTNIAVMDPPAPYTGVSDFWVMPNPRPDLLDGAAYVGLTEFRDPRHTFIITSEDGLDWNMDQRHLVTDVKNDTHPSMVLDPDGVFRAYIRGRIDGRRVVDMMQSTDLVHWSDRTTVMDIGSDLHQPYGMGVRELDGVYVGLMPMLVIEQDVGNGIGPLYDEIVTSRDAVDWQRDFPLTPVIPNGPDGAWDAGIVYHNSGILEWQGRWITAYGGGPLQHGGGSSPLYIGMAEFERGRLFQTGQGDAGLPARILTQPLELNGAPLLLNADPGGGSITVAVVDAAGRPLPGYGALPSTLTPIDALRHAVTWPQHATLPDGRYSLSIHLSGGATLYAFEGPGLYQLPEPPVPVFQLERQRFDAPEAAADAGWTGLNHGTGGNVYGWSSTTHAGGERGEAGGRLARHGGFDYFADTSIGTIDVLDVPLEATGRLFWDEDNGWSAGQAIGWFNTEDEGHDNVLGFVLNDPNTEGLARAEPRLYLASGPHDRFLPPIEVPIGRPLTFAMLYDPQGGQGSGLFSIELFDGGTSLGRRDAALTEADRATGISLNAFGIHTRLLRDPDPDLWANLYVDDLRYTTVVVPEPGTVTLVVLLMLSSAMARRRREPGRVREGGSPERS